MPAFIDLIGNTYGRLTVLKRYDTHPNSKQIRWLCKCICGNDKIAAGNSLKTGFIQSCGCLLKEKITKHGMWKSTEYKIWQDIKSRTGNPNHNNYSYYGGRGITLFYDWKVSFQAFYDYVGPRPIGTSLDRINNDGNYEPGNLRWATPSEQTKNRRKLLKHSDMDQLLREAFKMGFSLGLRGRN